MCFSCHWLDQVFSMPVSANAIKLSDAAAAARAIRKRDERCHAAA
jgi:hypothetical protein